jgi:hypothetical protein
MGRISIRSIFNIAVPSTYNDALRRRSILTAGDNNRHL